MASMTPSPPTPHLRVAARTAASRSSCCPICRSYRFCRKTWRRRHRRRRKERRRRNSESAALPDRLDGSNEVAKAGGIVGREIQEAQAHPGWSSALTEDVLANPTHLGADVDRFIVAG